MAPAINAACRDNTVVPALTVVVVSYNTRDLLRRCLASLVDHPVVVVDNASADGSADMVTSEFPHAVLIRNAFNRGFGAANNQGIDAARTPLVLLLNSDAEATPGAVQALAQVFDDPTLVAAGGRLRSPDGSPQRSAAHGLTLWALVCEQLYLERLIPRSRLFSPYWIDPSIDRVTEVEQVMGACLMFRPVERFDERFFLYCEDTELCRRLRRHGKVLFVPGAEFRHELGASSIGDRWRSVARYNRGKELYFALHQGPIAFAAAWVVDRLGALLRLLAWLVFTALTLGLSARARRGLWTFARVLLAPPKGPPRPPDTAR
jgi:GT2 family glycosyltransferase